MVTLSMGLSITTNHETHTIQFSKIDARIDGLDLEKDFDEQLVNVDEAAKILVAKLKKIIVKKTK